MRPLFSERLVIRNWRDSDRAFFHRINSDEAVMAFFPFRRSRAETDRMLDRLVAHIETTGLGFFAVALGDSDRPIGFAGLCPQDVVPDLPAGAVEIGWRLAPEHWGRGYATEAARRLLAYGFDTHDLAEIVSFAVWNNTRSLAVMERLGMQPVAGGDFDHPRVPDSHPQLKRHVLYRLTRAAWRRGTDGRPGA